MAFSAVASPPVVLDQACDTNPYLSSDGPSPTFSIGQSFTVGLTGTLAQIEVLGSNVMTAFPATRDHTLSLYMYGDAYIPANALASITQTTDSYSQQWFTFDFSQFNLQMHIGDKYLIM